jgi:transcriptional regulator GlxA family with amidase domain
MSRRGSKHNLDRAEWQAAPHAYVKRGMELPQTKLSPLDIAALRDAKFRREAMRKEINDTLSNAALARRFGVHVRTIEKVFAHETHFDV